MFKVHFPVEVEGVGISFYLDVGFVVCIGGLDECPGFVPIFSLKYPLAGVDGLEVVGFDPCFAFVGMSSFSPPPECLKDSVVYFGKCFIAGDMLMVLCPSSDDWVEKIDEQSGWRLFIGLDDLTDFGEEPFHVLVRGFNS